MNKVKAAMQSLWVKPQPSTPDGYRPLRFDEQLAVGSTVWLDGDTKRAWRFGGWQLCYRTRYALLDGADGAGLRVAIDSRLLVKMP